MNLQCDYCPRTASGSEIELLDEGWAWLQIQTPFCQTFVTCPNHIAEMERLAYIYHIPGFPYPYKSLHAEVL